MDEQIVLTAQTLRLNANVQRADVSGVAFVVKNVPSRKYLTITAEQWNLLRNFANPATVPDVLRAVILNRTVLPLREFYELVLKALRAGILRSDRQPETQAPVLARQWMVALGPRLPLLLTWISVAAAFGLLIWRPLPWPGPWPTGALNVFIGWLLLIAGVSLGHVFAASVLRGGGGEVYEPRFNLLRPVPYFSVNVDDACMCDKLTQASVWSVRLFPVAATAAALSWFRPEWGSLHVIALIVMVRPIGESAMTQLLSTVCRGHILGTQKNFLFTLNRHWRTELKFGLMRVSPQYVIARLAWGVIWTFLVIFTGVRAAGVEFGEIFGSRSYWEEVLMVFCGLSLLAVLAYVTPPAARNLYQRAKTSFIRNRARWVRWRANGQAPVTEEQIARMMADSLLLRRLPPEERKALSACSQPRYHKAWSTVHSFSDSPKYVSFILSGRAVVYRRLKSGRAERWLYLKEGDVFGAHGLLDPDRQQAQVRALTPLLALTIPIKEFQRRVVAPLGVSVANSLAQKVPFLQHLKFCESWHPQAVARFAQIAAIVTYNEGEVIVAERQESQQFYIIYEGRVVVSREGKVRSRLKAGAFFGELGLLQNSAAMSDVIAREPTRCLVINKADFLRFVTHNPLVAIQLEEISSKRLGHPIFPHGFQSFDVR